MSELINSTGFCLFCYKAIEFPNKTAKNIENIHKFIKLVERFAAQKQNKYICDFFENKELLECCKKCGIIIEGFCATYNQLKTLELKLDFMCNKLVDKINYANKVPARWIHVNRVLEETFQTDLRRKAESQDKIRKLRQNVVEAGLQRKVRSQPRVLLNQNFDVVKSSIIPEKMTEVNQSLKIPSTHQKYKIQKNWRCNFCEKRFTSKQNVRVHLRIHTGEKPFKCRFCQKDFRFRGDFKKHLTDNHWNEEGVEEELKRKWISKPVPDGLRIDDDGKVILKTKVQSSNQKRLECSFRNKPVVKYSVAGDFETETNNTANSASNDVAMIECTTFPNYEYEAEYDDVSELENYSGEVDDYDAEDPYTTDDHHYSDTHNLVTMDGTATFEDPLIQIKVEQQPVIQETFSELNPDDVQNPGVNECGKCGKMLKSAYGLQVHLEYHKDPAEWKYNCDSCGKRFATKYNLQAHARIHTKKGQSKRKFSVQARASRLKSRYSRSKSGNKNGKQINVKRRDVLEKEFGDIAINQVKELNVDESEKNRYSLRPNRVLKFTNEVHSDGNDNANDIEYNAAELSSDTDVSSGDEEHQITNKINPDQLKLKLGRPKSKKSTSDEKLHVECKICSKTFSSLLRKDRHFKTCHDLTGSGTRRIYSCKMDGCAAYFVTSVQARKHWMLDHGKTIRERREEKKRNFDCHKCNKKYTRECDLKRHLEYHKDPSEWKWECEKCNRKFAMKCRLAEHMKRCHVNVKPYKCKFCEKRFSKSEYINKHIIEEHMDEDFNQDEVANESIIKAGKIKSVLTGNSNSAPKRAHRKPVICPKPKILECEVCKRKFTSFVRKELHFKKFHDLSRISDKSKVKKCKAIGCNAYFLEKSQLKIHNSLEHGMGEFYQREKKFKCEKCGKGFINRNHLGVHLEYHKDPSEWKFECGTCGKKCVNEFKLKNHIRTHTKETPFQCSFCVEKFGSSSNLKRHLEKCHQNEEGIRAELDGKEKYGEFEGENGTDTKAKIVKVKNTKIKAAKVKNAKGKDTKVKNDEVINANEQDAIVFEQSSVFERETNTSKSVETSSERIEDIVKEIERNTREVINAKGSNETNVLTKKGDCFGDGNLMEFEDLD